MALTTLSELIYEPVNEEYGWGKYGEFRVLIRRKDGWVNVTKLCKDGGRELFSWTRLESANSVIVEVERALQICRAQIFEVFHAGSNYELSGTYAHPLLVPHIASWISPEFAVKVSRIVNDHLVREYREQIREKNTRIDEMARNIEHLLLQVDGMSSKLDVANENIIETLDVLGAVSKKSVPFERIPPSCREVLGILKLGPQKFYTIRAQRSRYSSTVAKKREEVLLAGGGQIHEEF
jgi:hypothetical protein